MTALSEGLEYNWLNKQKTTNRSKKSQVLRLRAHEALCHATNL
jgi:hypothetical protein